MEIKLPRKGTPGFSSRCGVHPFLMATNPPRGVVLASRLPSWRTGLMHATMSTFEAINELLRNRENTDGQAVTKTVSVHFGTESETRHYPIGWSRMKCVFLEGNGIHSTHRSVTLRGGHCSCSQERAYRPIFYVRAFVGLRR